MNTEFVEVTKGIFNRLAPSKLGITPYIVKDVSGEEIYDTVYYILNGNIIGSWNSSVGFCLEKSLVPERESGWYRVRLRNVFYVNKKELVVHYDDTKKFFSCGSDPFDENDFEWIDDNPIKFPEE
jgi:hypothetical protein